MRPLDATRLHEALALAEGVIGLTEPNPRVGCVIGHEDGHILGRGATQRAGGPHAEIVALRDAAALGLDVRGSTAWVTLEPCAHHGRTPPCCDALLAAGVSRVVAAIQDPFPAVSGRGIARLRAAGVEVVLADRPTAEAALELNIGFFSRVLRRRPWIRLKSACSLDGRTALDNGVSQWITGEAARADGHAWRRRASVVLTGIGTVLHDDPRLDVRRVPTARQPGRAIVDSRLRTPPDAAMLQTAGTVIYTTSGDAGAQAALCARGAEVVSLPGPSGGVDLAAVVHHLAERDANELHVEAGATLSAAFVHAGLVDELLVYVAPVLLGSGPGIAGLAPLSSLDGAPRFTFRESVACGEDLRLRLLAPMSAPGAWYPLDG